MEETNMSRKIDITGARAQYDEHAKYLLAEKIILAHILVHTITEFNGMEPEQVVPLIEGRPQVSEQRIQPGETNMPSVTGMSTEDEVPYEGRVTYDIRFTVWIPDQREQIKLIVDIEAQKDYYPGYDIVTRGVYNVARMISAQYGTEFIKSNYQNIKKVYSIWICMDTPKYAENTIIRYSLTEEVVIGKFLKDKAYYDIPHVIVVGLSKKLTEERNEYRLHRLLGTLLSPKISETEKKDILEREYHIPMTEDMNRRSRQMCNLSQSILEQGISQGADEKGMQVYINMRRRGMSKEESQTLAEISNEMVKQAEHQLNI